MASLFHGRRKPISFIALIVFSLVLFVGLSSSAVAEMGFGEEKFKVGDKAPDFTTVDLDGNKVTLSSFNDSKVVLLNFWGLRCGACIEEMPHLNALHHKYGEKGLVVLAVDTDGVDTPTVVSTMQEVGISADFTILIDPDFTITDTYTNFLVPLNIIIDKQGVIQYIHTGYEAGVEKEYEEAVVKVLNR